MSTHGAIIRWERGEADFKSGRYSREHTWSFDGGAIVQASPSPSVVPTPWSNPSHVDPEEAFVASISSCHMLTFLWLAWKQGLEVDRYEDHAEGVMTPNERGVPWVSRVTLRPRIHWVTEPAAPILARLHEEAHEQCFIANSVRTQIIVEAP